MHKEKLKGTDYQKKIQEMVSQRPAPGKWCALNSLRHISKAWEVCMIDPEMAFFRCACAEEEAAAALFHSLKRRGYPAAEHLNLRSHIHKFAVVPFIWVVKKFFQKFPGLKLDPKVIVAREGGKEKLEIVLWIPGINNPCKPDPPLHFSIKDGGKPYSDFWQEIQKLHKTSDVKDLINYLRLGSKRRSGILYARPEGIPTIKTEKVEEFIKTQLNNVTEILTLFLLIDPHKSHQLFVQQCLHSFVSMLGKVPPDFDPGFNDV